MDFSYNGKTITTGGGIKPSTKNTPGDVRTRVKTFAEIQIIPNPWVGMVVTVEADETNNGEMTDYKVKSLKADSYGVADSVIDEVVKYVDYLGVTTGGGVGTDGQDGATFTPSVASDGTLSWTNDKSLPNPTPVNIKGAKGDKGDTGATGANGQDGVTPTLKIGTTTTLVAGSSATVSMTKAVDSEEYTINFGIPKGADGTGGSGSTADLTDYQKKTDNTLVTTDKTVVGAINEVKNKLDNKVDKINGKGLSTNDYTTEDKATLSNLKTTVGDTSSGLVKDVKDLKTNGVSQDNINTAIENYLTEHPVQSGATAEQAAQIQANKTAIGDENSGLIKGVNDLTESLSNIDAVSLNGKKFSEPMTKQEYDAIADKEVNTIYLVTDEDSAIEGIPSYSSTEANKVLAVNSDGTALAWIDAPSGSGTGLTSEQAQHLQTAYEHSQSSHINTTDVNNAVSTYVTAHKAELKGDNGQDGVTPTFRVGSVTTLGSANNATVTMLANDNEYTLNFGIPRGAKGEAGASGSGESSSVTNSEWSGKVASFLGDSITYGANTTKVYHQYLKELVGFSVCNNYGIDGASVTNVSNGICTRYNNVASDSDIIFIFGGTNDFFYSKLLGEWYTLSGTTRTLNKDVSTFRGALAEICDGLITKFPTKQIILMTPIHRDRLGSQQTDLEANASGLYLDDYVECVKEAGRIFGIPVIDLNGESGLYPMNTENANAFFHEDDKLHPNANGHFRIAKVIQGKLRTILPLDLDYTTNVYGDIVLSKTSITMDEGTSNAFTVKLDKAPTNSQVVTLSVNNTDVTLSTNTLTFTSGNYDQAQEVTVNVTEDSDKTNDNCTITLSSSGVANKTVTLTINDVTTEEPTPGQPTPDQPSGGTDLTGKSRRVTFNANHNGINHLVFVIRRDEDCVAEAILNLKYDINNATNFNDNSSVSGVQIFGSPTPEVNNTVFDSICSDSLPHNTTFSNGSASVDFNYTLTSTNSNYLKVTYGLSPKGAPSSIDISNIAVTVNGVAKEILAIGAFFTDESCEVTEL